VSKDVWEPRGSGSGTPIAIVGGTLEKSEAVGTTGENRGRNDSTVLKNPTIEIGFEM
jgi:hypothetical protein